MIVYADLRNLRIVIFFFVCVCVCVCVCVSVSVIICEWGRVAMYFGHTKLMC